jgi:hypothetical protein
MWILTVTRPPIFFLQCGFYAKGPTLKKLKELPPEAPKPFQDFVESAAKNFSAYEQGKKFLAVCGDLLGILRTREWSDLIWIRKCYEDLRSILDKTKDYDRFIFRGTVGVGKSLFMMFWISYLTT